MPCVAEFPQLEALSRMEDELGCRFLALEVKGLLEQARSVVRDKKTTFTVIFDDSRYARETLHIPGTPTTFIVDREGRIRAKLIGAAEHIDEIIADVVRRIR